MVAAPGTRCAHVTLPMVTPTILFNLILSVIGAMQTFIQAYVSALAWILFLIIVGLSVLLFRSSSRWVYYAGR